MRIEIVVNVVNERNMSESSSKRGPKQRREDLQIQKENTGKEIRMLNWVKAGYALETSVIVGMRSDQFYG